MAREAFDQWFARYPKRPNNPKQPAWEEWVRLEKAGVLPSLPEMIDAADRYGAYIRKERIEPRFVAHARTWLHQRRYEEFIVIVSQSDSCAQLVKAKEIQALPPILSPVLQRVGMHWWNERFHECSFEDDGACLVIRTPHKFFMSRVELAGETVGRMTGRAIKVEMAA